MTDACTPEPTPLPAAPAPAAAPVAAPVVAPVVAPAWRPVSAMMLLSGTLHLLAPEPYEHLIPKELGAPRPWVTWSGVAELAIGVGLAVPRTRRLAGLASAALLAGVFPGNLEMTRRAFTTPSSGALWRAMSIARLPLQYPPLKQSLKIWRAPRVDQRVDRAAA